MELIIPFQPATYALTIFSALTYFLFFLFSVPGEWKCLSSDSEENLIFGQAELRVVKNETLAAQRAQEGERKREAPAADSPTLSPFFAYPWNSSAYVSSK